MSINDDLKFLMDTILENRKSIVKNREMINTANDSINRLIHIIDKLMGVLGMGESKRTHFQKECQKIKEETDK